MGFFWNKKNGGLMDVIRCDEEEYLIWKWRPSGSANSTSKENSIRYGSALRVKEGEVAVFVYKKDNESVMDYIVGPYDDTIKTANFPILTSIVGLAFGGNSPFQAEIYFLNLQGNNQVRFAVPYFDVADPRYPDFTIPVAVRGTITFNLTDYKGFVKLNRLIDFDLDKFANQIKDTVSKYTKSFVISCPTSYGIPVLQIERQIVEISDLIKKRLAEQLENDFGVNLKRFDLSAVEIDKSDANYAEFVRLTKEQQMRRSEIDTEQYERMSRLSVESQFLQAHAIDQQTEVLKAAAQNMGAMGNMNLGGNGMNPAGMMMGMAMGSAMGGQMAGMMNNMGQQMQQPGNMPPPIPTIMYQLSVNGMQNGPFNMQQLQQMVQNGQLTPQTYAWKQGMPTWELAGNIPEIASLFAPPAPGAVPPPPIK